MRKISIGTASVDLNTLKAIVFRTEPISFEISIEDRKRIERSHRHLMDLVERRVPVYGVTTGFGDSCHRTIDRNQMEELQRNLVLYLSCGTGPLLSSDVSRAIVTFRLFSLAQGFSGVSLELIERIILYLERDWIPVVPSEGSLGASGDLIPLAYLARILQGEGEIHCRQETAQMASILREENISPYTFRPKEALAIVNGTSAMTAQAFVNLILGEGLYKLSEIASAWSLLALQGKSHAFGTLVNERAKMHPGQSWAARSVREFLEAQGYQSRPITEMKISGHHTDDLIQDRYSIRCVPQILGPVRETLDLIRTWILNEVKSTSDNPIIGPDGELEMGGNFYGGYISHGMDYLKISLAHLADLADRQLAYIIDDKSNRGLPPNLANWPGKSPVDRHLHHGLKGLHQAVGAITSEVMALAIPNGIFSRSSESHNQDKVSLGMSAAMQCQTMIEKLYRIQALQMVCLAQAIDLRHVKLADDCGRSLYNLIRGEIPFVEGDREMGGVISRLIPKMKDFIIR